MSRTQGGRGEGCSDPAQQGRVTLGWCFWLWGWMRVLVPAIMAKGREPPPGRSIRRTGGPGRESQPSLGSPVPTGRAQKVQQALLRPAHSAEAGVPSFWFWAAGQGAPGDL